MDFPHLVSELEIRLVNMKDPLQTWTLKGHERAVLSVAFDPKGRYVELTLIDWIGPGLSR